MTKKQLDAIREAISFDDVQLQHAVDLLAEVEQLNEENTVLLEANEGEPWAWQVLVKQRDEARNMLEGICSEFERTVDHADWKAEGSKGMSVPFHGDFASAVQLPSVVGKMRWWSRQMRKVIGEKVE
jgi:hypothetical protein